MAWVHSRSLVVNDGERSIITTTSEDPLRWRTSLIFDAPPDVAAFSPTQVKAAYFAAKSDYGQLLQISSRLLSTDTNRLIDLNVAGAIEPPWETKDILVRFSDNAQLHRYTIIVNQTATERSSSLNHNTWSRWRGNVLAFRHAGDWFGFVDIAEDDMKVLSIALIEMGGIIAFMALKYDTVLCFSCFTDGLVTNSTCYVATHHIDGGISLPMLTGSQFGSFGRVEDTVIRTPTGSYHFIYQRQYGPWPNREMRWMILKRRNDNNPTGFSSYEDFNGMNNLPEVRDILTGISRYETLRRVPVPLLPTDTTATEIVVINAWVLFSGTEHFCGEFPCYRYGIGSTEHPLCIPVLGDHFASANSIKIDLPSQDFAHAIDHRFRFLVFYDRTEASNTVIVFRRHVNGGGLTSFQNAMGDWPIVYKAVEKFCNVYPHGAYTLPKYEIATAMVSRDFD